MAFNSIYKPLSIEKCKEIEHIIHLGEYHEKTNKARTHVEYLGLALLKYLVYTDIRSWRPCYALFFKDIERCGLTKGRRSKAVDFLYKRNVVHRDGKRWICCERSMLIATMKKIEKEIKREEGLSST